MSNLPGIGFENRAAEEPAPKLKPVALIQLIVLALALSTLIALAAFSIGFARAEITVALPAAGAWHAAPAHLPSNR